MTAAEPQREPATLERFWSKVDRSAGLHGCWWWTAAALKPHGYGQFAFGGRSQMAHRVAWMLSYGPIPDGMQVCHHCDHPRCVRPDHLFLGTNADNIADRMAKGRDSSPRGIWNRSVTDPTTRVFGERNGEARLTEAMIHEIRAAVAAGESQRGVARRLGLHRTTVWRMMNGRSWAHVPR